MSDHIPFEIQSEIMKRLPVKSLLQFRSVSKEWKSFIDSPKFIKNYHINHTNPQHHLLVRYKLDDVQTYTSITDNNTFPQQKVPLTAPESLSLLRCPSILSSVDGLLCFYGYVDSQSMAVIWNPTVRKSVGIVIPWPESGYIVVAFGVCPETSDPKLVKITIDRKSSMWVVEVFMLSTHVWKTVYMGAPFKLCGLLSIPAVVNGVIHFGAMNFDVNRGRSNYIISFDLKSEKFGEVCLPERLVLTPDLTVTKVNELLGLLEYYNEDDMMACGVWMRKDGANETFTKIYTIEGKSLNQRVMGFRNNGEVVMQLDDANYDKYKIEVYDPSSGHFDGVGINGKQGTISARSYMETLLLLDESDSIIH